MSTLLAFGGRSGEAMAVGLLDKAQVSELFLVVALTMALTPGLAELGQRLGKAFEKSDVKVRTAACFCLLSLILLGASSWPLAGREGWAGSERRAGCAGAASHGGPDGGAAWARHHRRIWACGADHRAAAGRAPDPLRGRGRAHGVRAGAPAQQAVWIPHWLQCSPSPGTRLTGRSREPHAAWCRPGKSWIFPCTLEMLAAVLSCTALAHSMQPAQSLRLTLQVSPCPHQGNAAFVHGHDELKARALYGQMTWHALCRCKLSQCVGPAQALPPCENLCAGT